MAGVPSGERRGPRREKDPPNDHGQRPMLNQNSHPSRRVGRSETIRGEDVGRAILVHNGRARVTIRPVERMVGLKYGEFAKTRTPQAQGKKKSGKKSR